ncbi:MAG: AAA family ATPase [Thermodesulfovibrio sp.]|nr:AAA family ATPase [Thermodesulfovibrio sp.]
MLPISLRFGGLNSYAREVKIDFTKFYQTKLFGIFGDTGGGKSTILDAITLSIYGKTPRLSSKNIREAINPFKGEINIEFIFEIAGKTYKIIRTINLNDNKAKLYKIDRGREIPIAEKLDEFNDKISNIIGLSFEEFCKVVVLPQNQFAELLRLKPAERADLVGKIFDLHLFGEPLYTKFAEKFSQLESTIAEKTRRLDELSEISEESIANKEKEIREITKISKELKQRQKEYLEKLNQIKNFKNLTEKKVELENQLKEMESMKAHIENLKSKIQMDDELAPYKKFFEELKIIEKSIDDNRQKEEKLTKILKGIESRLKEQKRHQEEFEKLFFNKNEELILKIKETEQLFQIEGEIKSLLKKQHEKAKELKELNISLKEIEKLLRQWDDETNKLVKDIEKNRTELENSKLNKEEIELYYLLPEALSKINEIKNLKEDIKTLDKKLERERKKGEEDFIQIQKEFKDRFNLRIESYEKFEELIKEKEREFKELKNKFSNEIEELKFKNIAFTLSKALIEGQPCPVCGNIEHPAPAKSIDERKIALLEKKLGALEEEIKEFEDLKNRIKPLLDRIVASKANMETYGKEIHDKSLKLLELENKLSQIFPMNLLDNAEKIFEQIQNRKKKHDEISINLNKLISDFHEKMRHKNDISQKRVEVYSNIQQINKEIEELQKNIDEKKRTLNEKTKGKSPIEIKIEAEKELESLKKEKIKLENDINALNNQSQKTYLDLEKTRERLSKDQENQIEILSSLEKKAKEMGVSISKLPDLIIDKESKKSFKVEIEKYEKRYNETKGALDNVIKALEEIPLKSVQPGELEKTEKYLTEINDKIAHLNENLGALKEQINKEKEMVKEKTTLTREIGELKKESENIKILKNLTYGKEMVKFFSWQFLKEIVRLTNELLKTLIGKRFLVNVSPTLEFTVTDILYNKKRLVNTLSGGETFLVSFALALALSSYIQSKRMRAIQFFFIDEGFSSLDRDLLDSVCVVLDELKSQDRLVGLISHLEELKQVVPRSIYVKRDNTGSSTIFLNA